MKKTNITLIFLGLTLFSQVLFAKVTATLPRAEISENESFQLMISIDETSLFGGETPDTSPLKRNFDILGQSTRSQSSWVNGKKSELTSWTYTLKPKQAGVFTIPPITVGKEQSEALSLKVAPIKTYQSNSQQSKGSADAFFIEATLNKNEAFVQEQLILTIKFNDSARLANIGLSPIQLENVNLTELSNTSYQSNMNGKTYNTYELRYALFTQKSGPLHIPKITVTGDQLVSTSRGRSYKPVRIQSDNIQATIKPIPTNFTAQHWLPAQTLKLTDSYSNNLQQLKVGDAVTLTVNMHVNGLTAEQLPEISLAAPQGFKIYPENAERSNPKQQNSQGVQSRLSQSFSLVATQAGTLTLPAIEQTWFNTQTQTLEIAKLPSRDIKVSINPDLAIPQKQIPQENITSNIANSSNALPEDQSSKASAKIDTTNINFFDLPDWLQLSFLSITFLLILSVLIIIYLIAKLNKLTLMSQAAQQANPNTNRAVSTEEIKALIDTESYAELRQAYIKFAQQSLPQNIQSLSGAQQHLSEGSQRALKQLDAYLYSQKDAPSKDQLEGVITDIQQLATKKNRKEGENKVLRDLYPQ